MTIKDIFATRGLVTTSGHVPLADYTPEADAPAVRFEFAEAVPPEPAAPGVVEPDPID